MIYRLGLSVVSVVIEKAVTFMDESGGAVSASIFIDVQHRFLKDD